MSTIGDWTDLPTNYEDARYSGDRKFEMKKNTDNTVSLTDVTVYENEDISRTFFGAAEANQINGGMNKLVGAVNDVINIMYPVGSIYMSVNSVDPSTLFGGTWERIKDRFLLCAGDSYGAGSTGGTADATLVSHTHTPVIDTSDTTHGFAVYAHNSGVERARVTTGSSGNRYTFAGKAEATSANDSGLAWSSGLNTVGDSSTGKNMPPYLAVYVWKRTA